MSEARDAILADIRRALRRRGPLEGSTGEALDHRTARHARHTLPAVDPEQTPAERFSARLRANAGQVTRVDDVSAVAGVVSEHLRRHQLPARVVVDGSELLAGLVWPAGIEVQRRLPSRDDAVAVTAAFAGIAETGTLALVSEPDSPEIESGPVPPPR